MFKLKKAAALGLIIGIILMNISVDFSALFSKASQNNRFIQLGAKDVYASALGYAVPAPNMPGARTGHAQSTLLDGRVLVTGGVDEGGYTKNTAYIFNPSTNTWTSAAYMPIAVSEHAQSTLKDGRVLITGGFKSASAISLDITQIYDPKTDTWSFAANLPSTLSAHAQSTLLDGSVLVTGKYEGHYTSDFTGIYSYNPTTNTWSNAARMPEGLYCHAQSILSDGRVLVTGGQSSSDYRSKVYIYSPSSNSWSYAANMPESKVNHAQSTLADGRVFVTGGIISPGTDTSSTYIYNPTTNSWVSATNLPNISNSNTQSTLLDGGVLVTGGRINYDVSNKAFIFYFSIEPTMTVISPLQNGAFCETDTNFIPQISVSDVDNDTLTCKYYIDAETTARNTKTVSNTISPQTVSFASLNMNTLPEGVHTIKYEVTDGKTAAPVTSTVSFKVDKSLPIIGTVTLTSAITSVTVTGSASDGISGLNTYPYRYTVGTNPATSWITSNTYTQNNLAPNTQYSVKFEARDAKEHIASKTQSIFTKAVVPSLAIGNPSSYTLDVSTTDSNPSSTQYLLNVNGGSQYVTPEGGLTSSPVWITLSGKKITVKGLNPSTAYSFQAKARNGEGIETAWSAAPSGTTKVAPPAAPANLIATATNNSVTVSWDPVQGALGYDILADGNTINVGSGTTYTHAGLPAGTPHTYQARARNDGGPGNWSTQISKSTLPASPGIPMNLNAFPQSTSVTVTWSNVPGATGYDIEVDGTLVNNGPNTNYIHSSLIPGTHHTYRVRSINPGGKSEWSAPVNATTTHESSPVPTNFTAVPSRNSVSLTWDAVSGATGYDIEVDGVTLDNNTRTSYTHTGLAPGSQHIYRVRSKKGGVLSDWSAAVVSTTLTDSFGTPSNVKAEASDTSVFLTWDPVPEAAVYDVEADGVLLENITDTAAVLDGLQPNTPHTYRVRARSSGETSDWSQPLAVSTYSLPTPVILGASSTETTINITWNITTGGAIYFDLEVDGSIMPDLQTNSYTCSGFSPNSQHVFRIRARNGHGMSNWSSPYAKSTAFSGVNAPAGLFAILAKTSVVTTWQPMNGVASYDLEVDGSLVGNIQNTKYTHAGLQPGTQHTYRVRAAGGLGGSGWSPLITVSTLPLGPAIPTHVTASSTTADILVTWDRMNGADGYDIEVDGVVVNSGSGTSYLHRGMAPNTQHTYRVRSKNASGFSAWSDLITISTKSSTMTYTIDCTNNGEFNLVFSASAIQELGRYTFTVAYDAEKLEATDLCGTTPGIDLAAGNITGTDIQVVQYSPGTIVFKKTGSAQGYQVWSGAVNTIRFRSKLDGQTTVTYSFQ